MILVEKEYNLGRYVDSIQRNSGSTTVKVMMRLVLAFHVPLGYLWRWRSGASALSSWDFRDGTAPELLASFVPTTFPFLFSGEVPYREQHPDMLFGLYMTRARR